MKRICTFALLSLSWWLAPSVFAQAQDLTFEQDRLPGGYVSNLISRVVQDERGFLWMATRAWLIKYDGYEAIAYRHNPQDSSSLASSKWVESVYVDREGTLWVGTFGGGLDRFDAETERFTHFAHDPASPTSLSGDTVTVMLEDRSGTFWVGTHQGLNQMDRRTGAFTRYRHEPNDPTSLSNDQVRSLFEDRDGTLWIGTGSPWGSESPPAAGGLNRFDPDTETFTRFLHDPADETTLIDNHVSTIFEDSRGTFWVGTAGDGLHTMDRHRGTFTRHLYDPDDPNTLSMPHLDEFTGPSYVSVVYEDAFGMLWIGAINGGLIRYDPATGDVTQYDDDLSTTLVSGILETREGVRWVASWDGLFKVVQRRSAFRHHSPAPLNETGANSVKALLEDRVGDLWMGSEAGGLSRFDWDDEERHSEGVREPDVQYLHRPDDPASLSHNSVLSLYEDRSGGLWVGTAAGLDRFDRASDRFTRFQHDPERSTSIAAGQVFSISEDRLGGLWAGIYGGGLSHLDRATGHIINYAHDPGDSNSLSDNDVVVVHGDREGYLWIGTLRGGLNRFDPLTRSFTRYPYHVDDETGLSDGFVTSIHEDSEGIIWIGTFLGGLNRFDPQTERFTHFTTANSTLPDDRVTAIREDEAGNLWMSTGNGTGSSLTTYDRAEGSFRTYDPGLILPSGNAPPGSFRGKNGILYAGGDNGFMSFSPTEVAESTSRNSRAPQIAFTGFRLFDAPLAPGTGGPVESLYGERPSVQLEHDQNTFSVEFVGLHFENPKDNGYSYVLEGYDDAWRMVGTERRAAYYKVPPGDYVLRVKAANSDGVWNSVASSMSVVIRPPWWRTWWAYVLYAGLFFGGIGAIDRLQRRRIQEVARRQAAMREAQLRAELAEGQAVYLESLDEDKSRFFANISHEFRTPLTLLLGPIRDLVDGRIDAERLASHAPLMHRNAARLLELINQLLDLSSLDAGGMHLHATRQNLVPFLRRHVLTFTSRAERDGVALVFTNEPDVIELPFDADKLEKVITNLLSNAFKFTPEGGRIRVMARQDEEHSVEITVRDTGEGIVAEELPLVFDRFYQVDRSSTRRHEGTGIGLSLVKELVELHGGTVAVESERGFGSTFTVRLPLHNQFAAAVEPDTPDERTVAPQGALPEHQLLPAEEVEPSTPLALQTADDDGEPVAASADAPPGAPTILIVEDNDDMRSYLRSQLAGSYRVFEARNGADGLRQVREQMPDLVISDVMMPEMDGFALCGAIKSDETIGHIPVVLLTAKADEQSRIEGFQIGADDYLPKPFSLIELTTRVENLVEIRRRLRGRFSESVRLGPAEIMVRSEDAAFVEGVRDVIETQMGDNQFGVNRLADAMDLSERQLHRRMKEAAGLTPAGYIRMMRLERASQLLSQQAGRVSDVAYAVGFKNAKHFSRLFRQTFGRAPSDDSGVDRN